MPASSRMPCVVMAGPLPPAVGGMASVIGNLLASRLGARYMLTTFDTTASQGPARSPWGVLTRRLAIWRAWWRALDGADIAHIHTCSGVSFFLDGALTVLARLRGVAVVLHIHGGRFHTFLDELAAPMRGLARWLARRSSRVVVLSETWRAVLAPRLPGAHLAVVENGVAIPIEAPAPPAAPVSVLFLGALDTNKGVFDLVRAAATLDGDGELVLAGPEGEAGIMERLRAAAGESGLRWRLVLPGAVAGAAKDALFARATVFALPSYFEGLPISMLEAMAQGIPVIATAVGAVPTVVSDGRSGMLVEPGDVAALAKALQALRDDVALRRRLGSEGRAVCRDRFSAERTADAMAVVYSETLNAPQSLVAG